MLGSLIGDMGHALKPKGMSPRQLQPLDWGTAPSVLSGDSPFSAHLEDGNLVTTGTGMKTQVDLPGTGIAGALESPEQTQRREMQGRSESMKAAGIDPGSEAGQEFALTGKLPSRFGDPLANTGVPTNIEVQDEQGNKRRVPVMFHKGSNAYTMLDGGFIDPSSITDTKPAASRAPQNGWAEVDDGKGGTQKLHGIVDLQSRTITLANGTRVTGDSLKRLEVGKDQSGTQPTSIRELVPFYKSQGYNDDEAVTMASWMVERQREINQTRGQQQTQNLSQQNQINTAISGVSGSRGGALPQPPLLAPGRPNPRYGGAMPGASPAQGSPSTNAIETRKSPTSTAGTPSRSVDSTPKTMRPHATTAGTAGATAPKPTAPVTTTAPTQGGQPEANRSAVAVQALIDKDAQASMAAKNLLGLSKGGGRNNAAMLGMQAGIKKLKQITGIQDDQTLSAEVTERDGARKALNMGTQRLVAYGQASKFVEAMEKSVRVARSTFGNDPKFWQKVKNHVNAHYLGDPEYRCVSNEH